MSNTLQENKMGVMPIGKLLLNMALPMIISMLVQALYNIVDSVYVSQVSESAVTALSLAFPVQNMQIGFAVGTGVGINSILSQNLGRRDAEAVNRTAGNGLLLMLINAAIFLIFGIFGVGPYYRMQSTVAETVNGGIAYTSICTIFALGSFLQIYNERLLQSTGRTTHSMITQASGAVINILLDPVFIFGMFGIPAMGVAGAAVATVIAQWISAIMGFYINFRFNQDVHLALRYVKPDGKIIRDVLTVGIPSIIMNGIGSVMNFGMNQIFQSFQETATGVFGIYYKLQSIFFMPLFGLNGATISIIAFNYGARKPKRIVETLKIACGTALVFMLLGLAAFQLIPEVLLGIFNPSDEFLRIGIKALRIISIHFPVASVCIIMGACFQALGNGIYSTLVSLCRQLIALLPTAYLLSLSGDVNMVWWAFPIAEVVSAVVTTFLFLRLYRQKIAPLMEAAA